MTRIRTRRTLSLALAFLLFISLLFVIHTKAETRPDRNLSKGMTGDDVFSLQQKLYEMGYLTATPDGVFGNYTHEALIWFQNDCGLYADGIAGPKTYSYLYYEDTGYQDSGTATSTSNSPYLMKGSTGDEVTALQQQLYNLGYLTATPDGIFGNYTQQAVIDFQKANGLGADGIAGPKTFAILYSDYVVAAGSNNDSGSQSSSSANTTTRNLYRGLTGDDVKALQIKLFDLGYLTATPDGIFGNYTYQAVVAFQQANGIGTDGIAGPVTMGKLNSAYAASSNNTVGNTDSDTDTGTSQNLSKGMKGDAVKALQQKLYELGYLIAVPDGIFGNYTYAAVSDFQQDNGLAVTGVADEATLAKLETAEKKSEVPADVDPSFTGFMTTSSGDWYFINGKVDTNKTCFVRTTFKDSTGWWYVKNGKVMGFISAPALSGISNAPGGIEVDWDGPAGSPKYRVYRRDASGSWQVIGETANQYFIDTNVVSGSTYTYTVRVISSDGSTNLSDYNGNGITFTYTYNYDRYAASVSGTVTKKQVEALAKKKGFDENEIKAIIGWVEGEAYHKVGEPYLAYLSACVLINGIQDGIYGRGEDVLNTIASWGSYYTLEKQQTRYDNASAGALKAVYIALSYPTSGLYYCRGWNYKPANCFYDSGYYTQGQYIYVW